MLCEKHVEYCVNVMPIGVGPEFGWLITRKSMPSTAPRFCLMNYGANVKEHFLKNATHLVLLRVDAAGLVEALGRVVRHVSAGVSGGCSRQPRASSL